MERPSHNQSKQVEFRSATPTPQKSIRTSIINSILILLRLTGNIHLMYKKEEKSLTLLSFFYNIVMLVFKFYLLILRIAILVIYHKPNMRYVINFIVHTPNVLSAAKLFQLSRKGVFEKKFWNAQSSNAYLLSGGHLGLKTVIIYGLYLITTVSSGITLTCARWKVPKYCNVCTTLNRLTDIKNPSQSVGNILIDIQSSLTIVFLCVLVQSLAGSFKILSDKMKSEEDLFDQNKLQEYRKQYGALCRLVESFNDKFGLNIAVILVGSITGICRDGAKLTSTFEVTDLRLVLIDLIGICLFAFSCICYSEMVSSNILVECDI